MPAPIRPLFLALLLCAPAAVSARAAQNGEGLDALYGEVPALKASIRLVSASKDRLAALARDPARFLAQQTYLGKPRAFRRFLGDKRAVDAFLADPVTSFVAGHAWAVRQAARPQVVAAVLASPAMQDKKLVSYLFGKTTLPLSLARAAGVAEALHDPQFVSQLCTPQVRAWLSANPAAKAVLRSQSPALEAALKGKR